MKRQLLLLWTAALLLALVGLGSVPLRDWDEAIVARVSLEISRSSGHDLLLPTYLGRDYLNKPPGLHLAIAGAIRAWEWTRGGGSADLPPEWLVRLVPAFLSSLLVPPISPALRLAVTAPEAAPVYLLERDAASLRPSLHWYLNTPGAPLEPEVHRWPRSRFRLISRVSPTSQKESQRCRLAEAGGDGWKRWDCRPRGAAG